MSDHHLSDIDRDRSLSSREGWDGVTMADLFLDLPLAFAHVELVDDPDALIQVMMHDLLTDLLCEV